MLDKEVQIPELYQLRHRHDNFKHRHFPWEKWILKKSTVPMLWKNPNMNGYMTRIEKIMVLFISQVAVVRNFWNISVNKYYNDHWD
jgi:hypothetical protein